MLLLTMILSLEVRLRGANGTAAVQGEALCEGCRVHVTGNGE
jgi:hypothetical protein